MHLNELENAGLSKRTLVIICSDHGEILNRLYFNVHGWPPCRQLVEVPVVFIPEQNVSLNMRLIDVFPTALDLMGLNPKLGDGKSCVGINRECTGINVSNSFVTRWKCSENGIKSLTPVRTFLAKLTDLNLIKKFITESPFILKIASKLIKVFRESM